MSTPSGRTRTSSSGAVCSIAALSSAVTEPHRSAARQAATSYSRVSRYLGREVLGPGSAGKTAPVAETSRSPSAAGTSCP